MKLHFVRHGQTDSNKNGLITGHLDVPLNDEGIEQAKKTLSEIPDDYSGIYSSDLLRCKQTAEILNQRLQLSIQYDPRLRERDFGSLSGKEIGGVDYPAAMKEKDMNQQYDYRPFGGECVKDVEERLFACIEDIRRDKKGDKVLVVTSGGLIRLLHKNLNKEIHENIINSSIHEFEFP